MAKKILSDYDFNNVSKILNLPDGVNPQDPVTMAQLNAAVEGTNWKDSVRVASVSNINLASPGATIDGVTMAANDRVLVKDQSTASQNGLYVWNGAAVPMTRSLDASTAGELEQAIVTVEEGTSAGSSYRQTTVNFTLDSGSIAFTPFGNSVGAASESTAGKAELATQAETDTGTDDATIVTPLKLATWSGRLKRASTTFGDGSATQYDLTHSFGSRDVHVQIYRVASPYDEISCDIERLDVNTVRLKFAAAPTTNQFRAVVHY